MTKGDTNNYQDVFVYDINADSTVIASVSLAGKPGNADSPIEQGEKSPFHLMVNGWLYYQRHQPGSTCRKMW
jgi:hypothetical protein